VAGGHCEACGEPLPGVILAEHGRGPLLGSTAGRAAAPPKRDRLLGYACPTCDSSEELFPEGGKSILDGAYYWECRSCGAKLGTIRPALLKIVYLAFALSVMAACCGVLVYIATYVPPPELPGTVHTDETSTLVGFALAAIVVGFVLCPVAICLVMKDMLRRPPRRA
jgi:hypothetical protein